MAAVSRLLDLAGEIQRHVLTIHEHLSTSGQSDPSFTDLTSYTDFSGLEDTRSSTLDLLIELRELLMTPLELLQSKAATDLVSRHALDRFNVYQAVPVGSTRTYTEIAKAVRLPLPVVRRLTRHAITQRIFHEPTPGVVGHTQASRLLSEDAHVRDYFGTVANEVWPAAARTVDAVEQWPYSTGDKDPARSGYALAKGCTVNETLHNDPVAFARYNSAMSANNSDQSYSTDHIARNFDWAALGAGTVVDVAGGTGTVSRALAEEFPALKFIVQDLEAVVGEAAAAGTGGGAEAGTAVVEGGGDGGDGANPHATTATPATTRIRFMKHDMFEPQPVAGADVYFFRRVFMEWDDEQAVAILRALRPALRPGHSRVLVADVYTPEPGACPLWQERKFRSSDLLALAISNAGSREREQWEDLFKAAGPGFEVRGITPVKNADIVLIEALWRGEEV